MFGNTQVERESVELESHSVCLVLSFGRFHEYRDPWLESEVISRYSLHSIRRGSEWWLHFAFWPQDNDNDK
jgi:hypothetical protein